MITMRCASFRCRRAGPFAGRGSGTRRTHRSGRVSAVSKHGHAETRRAPECTTLRRVARREREKLPRLPWKQVLEAIRPTTAQVGNRRAVRHCLTLAYGREDKRQVGEQ